MYKDEILTFLEHNQGKSIEELNEIRKGEIAQSIFNRKKADEEWKALLESLLKQKYFVVNHNGASKMYVELASTLDFQKLRGKAVLTYLDERTKNAQIELKLETYLNELWFSGTHQIATPISKEQFESMIILAEECCTILKKRI